MGYSEFEFKLPTDYSPAEIKRTISNICNSNDFSFSILKKSLDARNKSDIHWLMRASVQSAALSGDMPEIRHLELPPDDFGKKRKIIITGCGPAGIFSALILQRCGFEVTIIEKGSNVNSRSADIAEFEKSGILKKNSGYCFGEGGAGTFSDGKLTSRTKTISLEKNFIFEELIKAGAPDEIAYMAHPHLGSDNLKKIIPAIISGFISEGGTIYFDTEVKDLHKKGEHITGLELSGGKNGKIEGDKFIFATGHSSFDLYRMLLKNGVLFTNKPFAIGFRVEHIQEEINLSQWGKKSLSGVKAAEYRLTANIEAGSVFSFCMCPGGRVVQSAPSEKVSVVNGMSDYSRNGKFANSAVVTPFKIEELTKRTTSPLEALDALEDMEKRFFSHTGSFNIPSIMIKDLINGSVSTKLTESSYAFKTVIADFKELFPDTVLARLISGLTIFNRKLRGFDNGIAMGLESKTSAPLKAERTENFTTPPYSNLYICGEGSGNAGGIISSAADGVKTAMAVITS
ncbi:MAG TPA: FAD-dependent oxidoreductase [bacterium]|nr:FAD-dependent oxidoreductase [bacterium]HPS31536.1 FAD-dependent oxidoreductase [bacterium]